MFPAEDRAHAGGADRNGLCPNFTVCATVRKKHTAGLISTNHQAQLPGITAVNQHKIKQSEQKLGFTMFH